MNNKKIWAIIILMSVALVGVIMVQLFWIDNAIKLRHAQFVNKVNDAMNCVVNKLETQEAFSLINNQMPHLKNGNTMPDSQQMDSIPDLFTPFFNGIVIPNIGINDSEINIILRKHPDPKDIEAFFRLRDSTKVPGNKDNNKTALNSLNDSIQFYLKQSKTLMNSKMNKLREVMQKMTSEFLQKESNITHRIDPKRLDTLVKSEMVDHNIHSKCIYGILIGKDNNIVLTNDVSSKKELLESSYKVQLFPNDIFLQPNYLVFYYPASKNWVIRKLWSMLLLSFLFTLIIIIAFAYTILIIFKQKKLSEIKSDFINNMTHEFKTPIATISLAVDSINNPKVYDNKDKVQYYTGIIKEENNRMNQQVEQVLNMSLLDKVDVTLHLEMTNVHELIQNAVEKINLQVEQKNGFILEELEASKHIILADPVHISNIIFNLLDNANKYSPEHPQIVISTKNSDKGIRIFVEDKGIGMSKETQKKIFEKFYRVPSGNLHEVRGFGLGLSYVKKLVEAHHGTISVQSELKAGSKFEIFLPFEQ